MNVYLEAFIPLFVAINVPGILPLYIGLTEGMPTGARRRLLAQALTTALAVALVILFAGQVIFRTLGITLNDLRVGGGLILLVLSITDLLFGDFKQRAPTADPDEDDHAHEVSTDMGIVPIGIPLIVGPAAITTILVNQQAYGYAPALAALLANFVIVFVVFFSGPALLEKLGANMTKAVAKVASLFLAAIAVAMIRVGIMGMIAGV